MSYRQKALAHHDGGCSVCETDGDLVVHHVDGNRDNNSLDNLLPVCGSCHKRIHYGSEGFEDLHEELPEISRLDNSGGERTSIPMDKPIADRIRGLKPEHMGWNDFMLSIIEQIEADEFQTNSSGEDVGELVDETNRLRREFDEFTTELNRRLERMEDNMGRH